MIEMFQPKKNFITASTRTNTARLANQRKETSRFSSLERSVRACRCQNARQPPQPATWPRTAATSRRCRIRLAIGRRRR
jgi:hypothetical protein